DQGGGSGAEGGWAEESLDLGESIGEDHGGTPSAGERIGVLTHHSTGEPGRVEGVSFFPQGPIGTNVERNFKKRQRRVEQHPSLTLQAPTALGQSARRRRTWASPGGSGRSPSSR